MFEAATTRDSIYIVLYPHLTLYTSRNLCSLSFSATLELTSFRMSRTNRFASLEGKKGRKEGETGVSIH